MLLSRVCRWTLSSCPSGDQVSAETSVTPMRVSIQSRDQASQNASLPLVVPASQSVPGRQPSTRALSSSILPNGSTKNLLPVLRSDPTKTPVPIPTAIRLPLELQSAAYAGDNVPLVPRATGHSVTCSGTRFRPDGESGAAPTALFFGRQRPNLNGLIGRPRGDGSRHKRIAARPDPAARIVGSRGGLHLGGRSVHNDLTRRKETGHGHAELGCGRTGQVRLQAGA